MLAYHFVIFALIFLFPSFFIHWFYLFYNWSEMISSLISTFIYNLFEAIDRYASRYHLGSIPLILIRFSLLFKDIYKFLFIWFIHKLEVCSLISKLFLKQVFIVISGYWFLTYLLYSGIIWFLINILEIF